MLIISGITYNDIMSIGGGIASIGEGIATLKSGLEERKSRK